MLFIKDNPHHNLSPEVIVNIGDKLKMILEKTINVSEEIPMNDYQNLLEIAKNKLILINFEKRIRPAIHAMRISRRILRELNFLALDEENHAQKRKYETDKNGKPIFFIEHPIDVTNLAFTLLPKEDNLEDISIEERLKLKSVRKNPFEISISAFLHDLVEDFFKGKFDKKNERIQKTAQELITEILEDEKLEIPLDAQKRIKERLFLLTKPHSSDTENNKFHHNGDTFHEDRDYLFKYKGYLNDLTKANDPITQYIKLCDILQNAQSQTGNPKEMKRIGKACSQVEFIQKAFPTLTAKILREHPGLFSNMADSNLLKNLNHKFPNIPPKQT